MVTCSHIPVSLGGAAACILIDGRHVGSGCLSGGWNIVWRFYTNQSNSKMSLLLVFCRCGLSNMLLVIHARHSVA